MKRMFFIVVILFSRSAWANFGANIGVDWGLGQAGGALDTYTNRVTDSISFHGMPGYRWQGIMAGPSLEYSFIAQRTDVGKAANTNVKGHQLLAGIEGEYLWNKWLFGAGFQFLGSHTLSYPDSTGSDVKFVDPIGFKFVIGRKLNTSWPISLDGAFHYVRYRTEDQGIDFVDLASDPFTHWEFALGVTYRFGEKAATAAVTSLPQEQTKQESDVVAVPSKEAMSGAAWGEIFPLRKSEGKDILAISTDEAFGVGKTILNADAKSKLARVALALQAARVRALEVSGYTDTSGNKKDNARLSTARAANVAKELKAAGYTGTVISQGLSDADPLEDNSTAEGRSHNRRVEISFVVP